MAKNDTVLIYNGKLTTHSLYICKYVYIFVPVGYIFIFYVRWRWIVNKMADANSMKPQNSNVLGLVSNCECDHKYNFG